MTDAKHTFTTGWISFIFGQKRESLRNPPKSARNPPTALKNQSVGGIEFLQKKLGG